MAAVSAGPECHRGAWLTLARSHRRCSLGDSQWFDLGDHFQGHGDRVVAKRILLPFHWDSDIEKRRTHEVQLRVADVKHAAVGQMDTERLKWPLPQQAQQF